MSWNIGMNYHSLGRIKLETNARDGRKIEQEIGYMRISKTVYLLCCAITSVNYGGLKISFIQDIIGFTVLRTSRLTRERERKADTLNCWVISSRLIPNTTLKASYKDIDNCTKESQQNNIINKRQNKLFYLI